MQSSPPNVINCSAHLNYCWSSEKWGGGGTALEGQRVWRMHQRDETRRKKDWPTVVTGNSNVPSPQSHILCCLPVAAVTEEARAVEVEQLRLEGVG